MAQLSGQLVNATLGGFLITPNNTGITGTIQQISDGNGLSTALGLSTAQVNCSNVTFNGTTVNITSGSTLTVTPNTVFSGNVNINGSAFNVVPNTVFSGNVTISGTVTANIGTGSLANNAITYAKIQQASANTLIGNSTGSTANVAEISLPLAATYGGTGVNNGSNVITLAGSFTTLGAYGINFTSTANTALTLPVSGTLSTLAGTETLTNKTYNGFTLPAASTAGQHIRTGATASTFINTNAMHFEHVVTYTAASNSFTVPTDVTRISVELIGGGGGGGNTVGGTANAGAGGAGGGAYVRKLLTVTPGQVLTIAVGQAAAAASTGNATTLTGTGITTLTAGGGAAGGTNAGGSSSIGTGGVATNGDLNQNGSCGGYGIAVSGSFALGGSGGGNGLGSGTSSSGQPGIFPGGGGAGASGNNVGGTAGAAGYAIIYY
jgi:hypothetical protein